MTLRPPLTITARLLPGVRVGDSFISIEYAGESDDHRQVYRYFIDTPVFEHSAADLKSAVGGGSLQKGLESLLGFLGAAAESRAYDGDNSDLFPAQVVEWAYQNSDEISILECEIEETAGLIEEAA